MTNRMTAWGNGRTEFRESFDRKKPAVEELEEGPEFPESLNFGDEAEKLMVWETYQQLGKISFRLKYMSAKEEITNRVVTPLALAVNKGSWGFFAMCELHNDVRMFWFYRAKCIDPLPAVRHLTQWEASALLLVLAPHEQKSILDALEILDPVMYDKIKRWDGSHRRSAVKKKRKHPPYRRDGLTWVEWAHAAAVPLRPSDVGSSDQEYVDHRDMWRKGVDPTQIRMTLRERMQNERRKLMYVGSAPLHERR